MPLYERGDVRIHYEEAGSGFPLMVIPGGGLNSTVAGPATEARDLVGQQVEAAGVPVLTSVGATALIVLLALLGLVALGKARLAG